MWLAQFRMCGVRIVVGGRRAAVNAADELVGRYYATSFESSFAYDGDDLLVKVYFADRNSAEKYVRNMDRWTRDRRPPKPRVDAAVGTGAGVEADPPAVSISVTEAVVTRVNMPVIPVSDRITVAHYFDNKGDSPTSLWSEAGTSALETIQVVDMRWRYQRVQNVEVLAGGGLNPEKLHIIDDAVCNPSIPGSRGKKRLKKELPDGSYEAQLRNLTTDHNNFLSGKREPFHAMFDGFCRSGLPELLVYPASDAACLAGDVTEQRLTDALQLAARLTDEVDPTVSGKHDPERRDDLDDIDTVYESIVDCEGRVRYRVGVCVWCPPGRDEMVAQIGFRDGAVVVGDYNGWVTTYVYVLKPLLFKACLAWKVLRTRLAWQRAQVSGEITKLRVAKIEYPESWS